MRRIRKIDVPKTFLLVIYYDYLISSEPSDGEWPCSGGSSTQVGLVSLLSLLLSALISYTLLN